MEKDDTKSKDSAEGIEMTSVGSGDHTIKMESSTGAVDESIANAASLPDIGGDDIFNKITAGPFEGKQPAVTSALPPQESSENTGKESFVYN